MVKLHSLVGGLQSNLQKCQDNFNEIKNVLIPFARQPLFERKDGKKDTVLCIEETGDRLKRRHTDMRNATERIRSLLNQNQELFSMKNEADNVKWIGYVAYIDSVVSNYLYQSIGCR